MKKINSTVVLITLGTIIGVGLVVFANFDNQDFINKKVTEVSSTYVESVSDTSETLNKQPTQDAATVKLEKKINTTQNKQVELTSTQKELLSRYEDVQKRNSSSLIVNKIILNLVKDKIDEINDALTWNKGYRSQSQYDDFSNWLDKSLNTQLGLATDYSKYLNKVIETQTSAQNLFVNDIKNIKTITDEALLTKYSTSLQDFENAQKAADEKIKKFSDESKKLQIFIEGEMAGMSSYKAPTTIKCYTNTNYWGQLVTTCS